jgi:four helix bundle protein
LVGSPARKHSLSDEIGIARACTGGMVFKSLEELQVYNDSIEAADAISALLRRRSFDEDLELRKQLSNSSGRIPSHISEGYGQQTDRHFAHYLSTARGSANEVRSQLRLARGKQFITSNECDTHSRRYVRIGKRLTRLIQHLRREDRKYRG